MDAAAPVPLLPEHESLANDPKATDNYAPQVDSLFESLPAILAKAGGLEEATEEMLVLEKKARQALDGVSVSRLSCRILTLHKEAGAWDSVVEIATIVCKKRGQLKQAIIDIVHLGMKWIELESDKELKMKLIRCFIHIAEGKIFTEMEHARLIRMQAQILEEEGKIDEAALLLQEVQVETFAAMDRREKILYILDQMRLVLMRKDYIRCQIMSKKINPKFLEAEEFQDIRLQYYAYMREYYLHEVDYFHIAECYWYSFKTPKVYTTEKDWKPFLEHYVVYMVLAPHSDKIFTLLRELKTTDAKKLAALPAIKTIVDNFLSPELVDRPFEYEDVIKELPVFTASTGDSSVGEKNWERFCTRFMEHNVFVLSKYYSRILTTRAAALLHTTTDEIEMRVTELVNADIIYARIDRPAGIISFGKPKTHAEKLDHWTADIAQLLDLVQETTHIIHNERMIHAAIQKRRELLEKA